MSERPRCEAQIAPHGETRRCQQPATIRSDGKNYCTAHSPQAKAMRAFVRGQPVKGHS